MARGRLPEAVTAEDIIAACGGRPKRAAEPPHRSRQGADHPPRRRKSEGFPRARPSLP